MVKILLLRQIANYKKRAEQLGPKKSSGFGLVEVLIILGALLILELHFAPYFLRLVYKHERTQVAATGTMFSHQVGFMQSRARYQGHSSLSLTLSPLGKKYNIIDLFKVKQTIKLPDLALFSINILGPLGLSFQPLGVKSGEAFYTVVSDMLPAYKKKIDVQPVTGRVVTFYE